MNLHQSEAEEIRCQLAWPGPLLIVIAIILRRGQSPRSMCWRHIFI